jgi:uncharacterized membrane protein YdbT with pleckstrin-like domain
MPYAPEKYLLPTERTVIRVRRHWAILTSDGLQVIGLVVLAGAISVLGKDESGAQWVAWWILLTGILRFALVWGEWFVEKFVVTDMRVIITSGIITRKVAMMPLVKVTDMTYERSVTGQMLGYGTFIVESAGQDQALSRINFLPRPDRLYIQVAELLFGKRPAQDPAPD